MVRNQVLLSPPHSSEQFTPHLPHQRNVPDNSHPPQRPRPHHHTNISNSTPTYHPSWREQEGRSAKSAGQPPTPQSENYAAPLDKPSRSTPPAQTHETPYSHLMELYPARDQTSTIHSTFKRTIHSHLKTTTHIIPHPPVDLTRAL
eukprot:GHVN01053593.1.p1 GENE.GHVN01053593.1~~GHVN01053593.1.p1  ORF type:complete len:146 (+),score=20.35 GHVN01053593.1:257-694(+)